jgi:N-acyl-L-homoserine lactone synthetase
MPSDFVVSRVEGQKELTKIFRLRYNVYCHEWDFERAEDHPDGIETDAYDRNSVHFSVKRNDGKLVGTIRLILQSSEGFPIERHCGPEIKNERLPIEGLAEISRLTISRDCRKRAEDRLIYGPDEERRSVGSFDFPDISRIGPPGGRDQAVTSPKGEWPAYDRRWRHEILIGLCKAVYQESRRRGLTHWYAIMTKGLYFLLSRYGFNFHPIGGPVDFHGIRTPYLAEIKRIEEEVREKNPDLFQEFSEGFTAGKEK